MNNVQRMRELLNSLETAKPKMLTESKGTLNESITFSFGKWTEKNGKKRFLDPFMRKENQECTYCDGTGEESYKDDDGSAIPCPRCKGAKHTEEWVSDSPELRVSNENAEEVFRMLNIPFDHVGEVPQEQLPEIMRRLIKLKNGDISKHTSPNTVDRPGMVSYKDPETGLDRIGRGGMTSYNFGRTHEQVSRYIDRLIALVQFAQKHDGTISWG